MDLFWRNFVGMCVIACMAAMAINFVDGGLVYPMPASVYYRDGALPKKRPFCNAFTGCGRKRTDPNFPTASAPELMPQQQEQLAALPPPSAQAKAYNPPQANALNGLDDRLGDLLDLNSEPAVEDLMRQIMSQAKMWEAIQEANREMTIQKNDRNSLVDSQRANINFPTVQFNSQ